MNEAAKLEWACKQIEGLLRKVAEQDVEIARLKAEPRLYYRQPVQLPQPSWRDSVTCRGEPWAIV